MEVFQAELSPYHIGTAIKLQEHANHPGRPVTLHPNVAIEQKKIIFLNLNAESLKILFKRNVKISLKLRKSTFLNLLMIAFHRG